MQMQDLDSWSKRALACQKVRTALHLPSQAVRKSTASACQLEMVHMCKDNQPTCTAYSNVNSRSTPADHVKQNTRTFKIYKVASPPAPCTQMRTAGPRQLGGWPAPAPWCGQWSSAGTRCRCPSINGWLVGWWVRWR